MHLYLSPIIGDGTIDNFYRPQGKNQLGRDDFIDLRLNDAKPGGYCLFVTELRDDSLVPDGVYIADLGDSKLGVFPDKPIPKDDNSHLKGDFSVTDEKIKSRIESKLEFSSQKTDIQDVLKDYIVNYHPRFLPNSPCPYVISGHVIFHYDPVIDGPAKISVPTGKEYKLSHEEVFRVSSSSQAKTVDEATQADQVQTAEVEVIP